MNATGRYPARVLREHELDPGTRLTLIALYACADEEKKRTFMSAQELADLTGCAQRTVHHHLKRLTEKDWIRRVKKRDPRSAGHFFGVELCYDLAGKRRKASADD